MLCFHFAIRDRVLRGGIVSVFRLLLFLSGNNGSGCKSLGSIGISLATVKACLSAKGVVAMTKKAVTHQRDHATSSVALEIPHALVSSSMTA